LAVAFGCRLWLSPLAVAFGCRLWLSPLAVHARISCLQPTHSIYTNHHLEKEPAAEAKKGPPVEGRRLARQRGSRRGGRTASSRGWRRGDQSSGRLAHPPPRRRKRRRRRSEPVEVPVHTHTQVQFDRGHLRTHRGPRHFKVPSCTRPGRCCGRCRCSRCRCTISRRHCCCCCCCGCRHCCCCLASGHCRARRGSCTGCRLRR